MGETDADTKVIDINFIDLSKSNSTKCRKCIQNQEWCSSKSNNVKSVDKFNNCQMENSQSLFKWHFYPKYQAFQ